MDVERKGWQALQKFKRWIVAGIAVTVLAGLVFAGSALAQPAPPSSQQRAQMCQGVLSSQAEAVVNKYRERAQTARDNLTKEERALVALLIADNSTRAAVDAQTAKANDARLALTKIRLDMLWELRSIIPAQNREQVFRCAEFSLLRRR